MTQEVNTPPPRKTQKTHKNYKKNKKYKNGKEFSTQKVLKQIRKVAVVDERYKKFNSKDLEKHLSHQALIDLFMTEANIRYRDVKQGLSYKGTSEHDLTDNILSRLEDVFLLIVNLAETGSIAGFASGVGLYLKTIYPKPIVKKLTEYIIDMLPTQTVETGALLTNQAGVEIQGEDGFVTFMERSDIKAIREYLKDWKNAGKSLIAQNLANVVNILVTVGLLPKDLEENPIKLGFFEIFKAKAWDMQKDCNNFVEVVIETSMFFLERGYVAYKYGDLSLLMFSSQEAAVFENEFSKLVSAEQFINDGCLAKLRGYEGFTNEYAYQARLEAAITKLINWAEVETNEYARALHANRLVVLRKIRVALECELCKEPIREKPIGVLVHGPSSLGKTTILNVIIKTMLTALGEQVTDDTIVTLNDGDKFQSEIKSSHQAYILDDFGNTKAEHYDVSPTKLIIDVLNNVPRAALKAGVDSKGRIMMRPRVVGATSNIKTLLANIFSNEPPSIIRRFDFHVTGTIRPAFLDPSTNSLDQAKMNAAGFSPDAWSLTLQTVRIIRGENGKKDTIEYIDVMKNATLDDVRMHIAKEAMRISKDQRQYVESTKAMLNAPMCKECMRPIVDISMNGKCVCDQPALSSYALPPSTTPMEDDEPEKDLKGTYAQIPTKVEDSMDDDTPPPLTHRVDDDDSDDEEDDDDIPPALFSRMDDDSDSDSDDEEEVINNYRSPMEPVFEEEEDIPYPSEDECDRLAHQASVEEISTFNPLFTFSDTEVNAASMNTPSGPAESMAEAIADWYVTKKMDKLFATVQNFPSVAAHLLHLNTMGTLQQCFEKYKSEILVAVGLGSIASITAYVFTMWKRTRGLNFQDSVQKIPERFESDKPNKFRSVKLTTIPRSIHSSTCTHEQLIEKINKNIATARIYVPGVTNQRKITCILPLEGNVWVMPYHTIRGHNEVRIEVTRAADEEVGYRFEQIVDESHWEVVNGDLAIIRLPSGGSVPPLSKFLPTEDFDFHSEFKATSTIRTPAGSIIHDEVSVSDKKTYTVGKSSFIGLRYNSSFPTYEGQCMAPLVIRQKRPCIAGLHIAGVTGAKTSVAAILTQKEFQKAIEKLNEKLGLSFHSENEIVQEKYGIDYPIRPDISPKHACLHVPLDNDGNLPSASVYGSHDKGTVKFNSQVQQSPISDAVTDEMYIPREHGPPAKKNAYKHYDREFKRIACARTRVRPKILKMAMNDLKRKIRKYHKKHPDKINMVHPYPYEVAMSGVDGVSSVSHIDWNTSMSWPINKPKKGFVEEKESTIEAISVMYDFADPQFRAEIDKMIETLAKGFRIHAVFRTNLKDEPTPFIKDKIRVFAGCEVAFTVLVRMFTLSIIRYVQDSGGELECAVGVNPGSEQWTKLAELLTQFGEEKCFFNGDFSGFDKELKTELLLAAFDCLWEIARIAGWNDELIAILQGIASEISNPLYEFDGVFASFLGSNPSGHPLTVILNNLVNQLYMRIVYYTLHEFDTGPIPDFDERIALMCYGDDNAGGVHKDERKIFKQSTITAVLADLGLTYTMADKTSAIVDHMDFSEISFLKRKWVWSDEMKLYLAPIELGSISKSLHNYMNRRGSDVLPEEIAGNAVTKANMEFFHYGRKIHAQRRAELQRVVEVTALQPYVPPLKTWDQLKQYYLTGIDEDAEPEYELVESELSFQSGEEVAENVKFLDGNEGHEDERGTYIDPLRDSTMIQDVTLGDFMSRPVKISELVWEVGNGVSFTFNPWSLFFANPRVSNRIANYHLMSCTLHLKFVINGNSFFFGRLIASYIPLHTDNDLENYSLIGLSQKPHLYLDPCCGTGGDMVLPFFWYKNLFDIVNGDWTDMGEVVMQDFGPLKHANGAAASVSIGVFAWAEDVKLSIPTQQNPFGLSGQSGTEYLDLSFQAGDEYGSGIISRPATVVAKAASHFTAIPMIGNFARATELGAKAISAIASIFGYSRPAQLEIDYMQPTTKSNFAITNGPEQLTKLTIDSKQELSIDPKIAGLHPEDEMSILSIAMRESYLTTFDWAIGTATEQRLWSARVDPALHAYTAATGALDMPACCFAVMPFEYYKGSMRFRFQVICSDFHKGRLRVVYDPHSSVSNAEYNLGYSTIIDLKDKKDFSVDCGWGNPFTFGRHSGPGTPQDDMYGTGIQRDTSSNFGNGIISVYIMNELTTPNSVVDNDVKINVHISMLDDFEVAAPTGENINTLFTTFDPSPALNFQSGEEAIDAMQDAPDAAEQIDMFAKKTMIDGTINRVHFGEVIGSFRQLTKRYNLHEVFKPHVGVVNSVWTLQRPLYPYNSGYTNESVPVGSQGPLYTLTNTFNYFPAMFPMVNYVSLGFAGKRGGMRYALDLSESRHNSQSLSGTISRGGQQVLGNFETSLVQQATTQGSVLDVLASFDKFNGQEGTTRWSPEVNPIQTVELPYYSAYRFAPAKRGTTTQIGDKFQPGWSARIALGNTSDTVTDVCSVPIYVAGAEDYTCFFFTGAPILYYQPTRPSP